MQTLRQIVQSSTIFGQLRTIQAPASIKTLTIFVDINNHSVKPTCTQWLRVNSSWGCATWIGRCCARSNWKRSNTRRGSNKRKSYTVVFIKKNTRSLDSLKLSTNQYNTAVKQAEQTNKTIDSEVRHHIPNKYGVLRKYRLNKSDDNNLKLRSLSQHVKYLVKRKHRLYLEKTEGASSENPKLFWSYYKAVLHHRAKQNSVITYYGIEATTPAEKWIFQILIFHPSLLLRVPL